MSEEILGAFLLVNDYRTLTNEELNDVKSAINCLQQDNAKLKEQRSKAIKYLEKNFYYYLASGDDITYYIDELIDYLNGIKDIKIIK